MGSLQYRWAGQPQPSSEEEAQRWADELLVREKAYFEKQAVDAHTVFFIPMQYFAFVWASIALVVLVLGFVFPPAPPL